MEFPIFFNLDRPNGRKPWNRLSYDQKRKLRNRYYAYLKDASQSNLSNTVSSNPAQNCAQFTQNDYNVQETSVPDPKDTVENNMAENISNSSHDFVSANTSATTPSTSHIAADNFHEDVPNCNPLQVMSVLPDTSASLAIHAIEDNICENITTCANDNLVSTSTSTSAPDVDHVVKDNVTEDVPCSGQSSSITASISDDALTSEPGADDQITKLTPNPYIHSNHIFKKLKINHPGCFQHSFQSNLAECFTSNKINQTQSKAILNVLHTHPSLKFLPKDPRTLLMTPRDKIEPKIVEPGNYLHLGIEWMLLLTLSSLSAHEVPNELIIDFSTDGAEMNKNIQIWPIQIRIVNIEKIKKPMGYSMPNRPLLTPTLFDLAESFPSFSTL
ncbi:uncharacterized protein LOC123268910 [Cotesia glomerata]|uniref:uncharacterized protein LOC123268910 n=1 Tax=Cotesia glomerata TaxID=32391 RepID=UPI001D027625|nr:uncharacterized protein LOC123268910 [Cotesia glomerata]